MLNPTIHSFKYGKHSSVLLYESIKSLNIKANGIYLDCTFGMGGHSKLILSNLNNNGKLLSFDCDSDTYIFASLICDYRYYFIRCSFSNIYSYLLGFNLIDKTDGILLDLGISFHQIEKTERGFSFYNSGPLDMRMDNSKGKLLFDWLTTAKEYEVNNILKSFGDEKQSIKISKDILIALKKTKITRTTDLSKVITASKSWSKKNIHPATCSFQAFRIYINNELEELKSILNIGLDALSKTGRLAVLSFNSIEDKLVNAFIYENSHVYNPNNTAFIYSSINYCLRKINIYRPSKQEAKYSYSSRSVSLVSAEKLLLGAEPLLTHINPITRVSLV